MNETVQLMFDGEMHECTVTIDRNNEYLCESANGRFAKFPSDANLEEAVTKHNEVNSVKPEIIPDAFTGEMITFDSDGIQVVE